MNWDDLRFVGAVASHGSLLKAAKALGVQHTTVGRRVEAAERALGVRLFVRTSAGLVLTAEGQRLVAPLEQVEEAVNALERRAVAGRDELTGNVRVTAPETFGAAWLAPRLAVLARRHPGLAIDLNPTGEVLSLDRRQAELAVRFFRSTQKDLVVRRVGTVAHGLYAARSHLARQPFRSVKELAQRPLLSTSPGAPETAWLERLSGNARPAFVSTLSLALLEAARAGAGIAVLPRYLGDAHPELMHLPMPDEPSEPVWLTVHRDLRTTPRVRAVLEFLVEHFERDAAMLSGTRTGG
ncbi:MAG: LysR family transcriptional regulator [Myxococcaceae bacterium]|jgi:DNA-binding transcriptional LysR family regulator|nr:LysR family transcriptional regulator [Myxococcaceae bacterium]